MWNASEMDRCFGYFFSSLHSEFRLCFAIKLHVQYYTQTEIRVNSHLWSSFLSHHWHQFKMTELLVQLFEELIQIINAVFRLILWKYQRNTITKVSTPNKKLLCQKYVNQIRAVCHLHDILSFRWILHANFHWLSTVKLFKLFDSCIHASLGFYWAQKQTDT